MENKICNNEGIDCLIDIEEESNSSDVVRLEESWEPKNEEFLIKIKNECLEISAAHGRLSRKNKKYYVSTSIPTIIIPLILANLSVLWENSHQYINSIGLTVVGIINGLQILLNFSKKSEIHNKFSGHYAELSSEISKILIRKKRFRSAFDVILERVTEKKNSLDEYAPVLPI
mgnify:CR=1 FL=1|tara:strand:- start:439 stop:957 length:519 start_codon:yes stop_codon:yes gene_type:complete